MSNTTIIKKRTGTDISMALTLTDNGARVSWKSLSEIYVYMYADDQRVMAGLVDYRVSPTDEYTLLATYGVNEPQYLGVNRVVISCNYMGKTRTYDAPVVEFVEDLAGEGTSEADVVSVALSVAEVSTSLLDEAIAACIAATVNSTAALEDFRQASSGWAAQETAREQAEAGRVTAESARATAESGRSSAESARATAEGARATAESSRASAESERAEAEVARDDAEANRAYDERVRQTMETSRQKQETVRQQNDVARGNKMIEFSRRMNENQELIDEFTVTEEERAEAELARQTAESRRVTAETARASAETTRQQTFQASEQSRSQIFASKEAERDAAMETISQEAEKLTDIARKQSELARKLNDVEGEIGERILALQVAQDGKYINKSGGVGNYASLFISQPFNVKQGDVLKVSDPDNGFSIIATPNGATFTSLVYHNTAGKEETYVVPSDMAIVICGTKGQVVTKLTSADSLRTSKAGVYVESLLGVDGVNKASSINWNVGAIRNGQADTTLTAFRYSDAIQVKRGDVIIVHTAGVSSASNFAVSEVSGTPSVYIPKLIFSESYDSFVWVAEDDMNVAIGYRPSTSPASEILWFESDTFGALYRDIISKIKSETGKVALLVEAGKEYTELVATYSSLKNDVGIPLNFSSGFLNSSTGQEQTNANRIRTGYIDTRGFLSLVVSFNGNWNTHLYDEDKNWLGYVPGSEGRLFFNRSVNDSYSGKQASASRTIPTSKVAYVRMWFDTTNADDVSVKVGTSSYSFKEKAKIKNCNILAASHQGSGTHSNASGIPLTSGNNRLSAVWGAYVNGYDMILCNQKFTSDGVCVCNHDGSFTDDNGVSVNIANVTFAELQTHLWGGEKIPSLDSVVYLAKMLGLKVWMVNAGASVNTTAEITSIINIVRKYQMWDNTWFMTDSSKAHHFTDACSRAKLALLAGTTAVDVATIKAVVDSAATLVNSQNEVVVWISGENEVETFEEIAMYLPNGVKLGFFNNQGSDAGDNDESILARIPYASIYSSKSPTLSIDSIHYALVDKLKAEYPEIVQPFSGL